MRYRLDPELVAAKLTPKQLEALQLFDPGILAVGDDRDGEDQAGSRTGACIDPRAGMTQALVSLTVTSVLGAAGDVVPVLADARAAPRREWSFTAPRPPDARTTS